MLIQNWRFVTILLVVLPMGLAFAHVFERPAKMQYDAQLYVTLQKTLYVEWVHRTSAASWNHLQFSRRFRLRSSSAR
jgi:hypothetical protein